MNVLRGVVDIQAVKGKKEDPLCDDKCESVNHVSCEYTV